MPRGKSTGYRRAMQSWIRSLARTLEEKASSWDAWSVREALSEADLWHRMDVAGYVESKDTGTLRAMTREEKVKNLLDELYKKGMSGDSSAVKAFMELSSQTETKSAFDVHIDIEKYTISDTSLAAIVMDADEKPVGEILKSWVERCRIDNFSSTICERAELLFNDWIEEAAEKFKDVKDIPKLAQKPEEETAFESAEEMNRELERVMPSTAEPEEVVA